MAAPTLETERLRLRPWQDGDRDAWADMMADSRVCEFLGGIQERAVAREHAARFARRLDENGYGWWVAEVKASGAFAGVIVLQEIPFEAHFTPATEVGWHFAFEYWGRGYATEGGRAATTFAFAELDREEVVAITARQNARSQRVMERLGMTRDRDGDFDNPYLPQDSPIRRHVLYRKRRPESAPG